MINTLHVTWKYTKNGIPVVRASTSLGSVTAWYTPKSGNFFYEHVGVGLNRYVSCAKSFDDLVNFVQNATGVEIA